MYCMVARDTKENYKTKHLANGVIACSLENGKSLTFLRLSFYLFLIHGWIVGFYKRSVFKESPMVTPWGVTYSSILDAFLRTDTISDVRVLHQNADDYLVDEDLVHEPEAFIPDTVSPADQQFWWVCRAVVELYCVIKDKELAAYMVSSEFACLGKVRQAQLAFVPDSALLEHFSTLIEKHTNASNKKSIKST